MPRFGKILGKVVRAGGRPVEDLNVFVVSGPSHPDLAAITAPDGSFSLGALQPGRYVLSAGERVEVEVLPGKVAFVEVTLTGDEVHGEPPASEHEDNVVEGQPPESDVL